MLNTIKIELNEGISNLKNELNALKEDLQTHISKQDTINSELVSQTSTIINMQAQSASKDKSQSEVVELQTNFFLLEGKITQIEAKVTENFKKMMSEFDKVSARFEAEFKCSNVFMQNRLRLREHLSSRRCLLLYWSTGRLFERRRVRASSRLCCRRVRFELCRSVSHRSFRLLVGPR